MLKALMLKAVALGVLAALCAEASAQAWKPPRTSLGQPDLQGVWTNDSLTKLERSRQFDHLVLTDAEVKRAEQQREASNTRADGRVDPTIGAPTDRNANAGYNNFWMDRSSRIGRVRGQPRSSWIVEPADGRIPYSPAGRALIKTREAELGYNGPEQRPLPDRCLLALQRNGPPIVNGLYNNHTQIVQGPDHVVIVSEMMQNARIIPFVGVKAAASQTGGLFGDARAHWEGDALVILSTGFSSDRGREALPAFLSPTAKVTERFTRVAEGELLYEFTVDDPVYYSQPWRGEETFWNDGEQMYEFACHEGNYALAGILRGARVLEAKGLPVDQTQGRAE